MLCFMLIHLKFFLYWYVLEIILWDTLWQKTAKTRGSQVQVVLKVFSIPILDFFTWFFQWELPSYPAWWAGSSWCSTPAWRWGACISTHRPGKVGWHDQQVFFTLFCQGVGDLCKHLHSEIRIFVFVSLDFLKCFFNWVKV